MTALAQLTDWHRPRGRTRAERSRRRVLIVAHPGSITNGRPEVTITVRDDQDPPRATRRRLHLQLDATAARDLRDLLDEALRFFGEQSEGTPR